MYIKLFKLLAPWFFAFFLLSNLLYAILLITPHSLILDRAITRN